MRRTLRHLFIGASASLVIAGCGITATKKNEDKKDSEDASGIKAGASVNNQQFSLSLPYLPDVKPGTVMKAHIRIFTSHVSMPTAYVDCAAESYPAVKVDVSTSDEAQPSVDQGAPGAEPQVSQNPEKEFGLTQRPAKAVYEDSMEYKVGASIGPILLDPGLFTAILDVYDERGKRYTGTSWFEVKMNVVSNIAMKMEYVNDCGGSGGVIITPIVPSEPEPEHLVSACEFQTMEAALCKRETAVCYYKEYKAHSQCGSSQARQQLIGTLCQKDVRVPKTFKEEIVCDVSVQPQPQPQPQPETPKPTPPTIPVPTKSRACLQLELPCDLPETTLGAGCTARFTLSLASGAEASKTITAKTGAYCKDRHMLLSQLCKVGAGSFSIQCTK